jgi:UDP-N-acetylmuramoylalanine--D-glutamate ligase
MQQRIVILGAGESGVGAALLAMAKGYEVFVSDFGAIGDQYKKELKDKGIEFEEGKHTEEKILNADEVIKSPGIPDNAPIVKQLHVKNIPVISELEFAFRFTKAKFISITGTNGKTTTTLLIYHLLNEAGKKVGLAGNVGVSLAKQVIDDVFEYYVLEVSSFQLDGMFDFRSDIAILLNITPDHLDRYEYKMENYIDSKFRVTRNMRNNDSFIYFDDHGIISENVNSRKIFAGKYAISLDEQLTEGGYLLTLNGKENLEFNISGNPDLKFEISTAELPFQGKHNYVNTMAAVLAAVKAGVSIQSIRRNLNSFKNAPHRLEFVANLNGVDYINDSKATNVDSVYYALESFKKPLVWIAGGIDKGNNYDQIKAFVKEKVKALVCMGKDNSRIMDAFKDVVPMIEDTKSIHEAVLAAEKLAQPGDAVLLSPACASFDLFKNYEDRGIKFKDEVYKLKDN